MASPKSTGTGNLEITECDFKRLQGTGHNSRLQISRSDGNAMKDVNTSLIPAERIERSILLIRGQKVMLDSDLAVLYDVDTKRLLEAVKRNIERFPDDFMFQLTPEELEILRSQIATSSSWGGRRYAPYAFTEQGVAMLSTVLRSPTAVRVNIEIMRAFVRLRQMLASHAELSRKLDAIEKKYDSQFKAVFDAIRQLMIPPDPHPKRPIGFHAKPEGRK
jgi:hypothetical protein